MPSDNYEKDIRSVYKNKKRSATSKLILQNRLLIKLFPTFRKIIFIESKFPISITILNIRYKNSRCQKNNLFYIFIDQLDYALVHYFAESETTKCNINKFFLINW